jgi:hypothetical protein
MCLSGRDFPFFFIFRKDVLDLKKSAVLIMNVYQNDKRTMKKINQPPKFKSVYQAINFKN